MGMKRMIYLFVAVMVILVPVVVPAYTHGGGYIRGGIWIGPVWPWWGPPYYPYYYSEPPVVIQQQAPIYEQQTPQVEEQPYYWYFCPQSKAYYPYVKQCPGGWMKVVPDQSPPKGKE